MSNKITKDISDTWKEKPRQHQLTDYEFSFLKELNTVLTYNTYRDKVLTNFLTYVAMTRLGHDKVKKDHDLQFKIDLNKDDRILEITEVLVKD